jgi:ribosomal protein S21
VTVLVEGGQIDRALKVLKRRFGDDIAPSLRRHESFLSRSERRRIKATVARKRQARLARKQASRDQGVDER